MCACSESTLQNLSARCSVPFRGLSFILRLSGGDAGFGWRILPMRDCERLWLLGYRMRLLLEANFVWNFHECCGVYGAWDPSYDRRLHSDSFPLHSIFRFSGISLCKALLFQWEITTLRRGTKKNGKSNEKAGAVRLFISDQEGSTHPLEQVCSCMCTEQNFNKFKITWKITGRKLYWQNLRKHRSLRGSLSYKCMR